MSPRYVARAGVLRSPEFDLPKATAPVLTRSDGPSHRGLLKSKLPEAGIGAAPVGLPTARFARPLLYRRLDRRPIVQAVEGCR
jgi:hypothetical protein